MNVQRRPQFSDIESYGLTHRGKVRPDNQDHFFLGPLTSGVLVERTSLDHMAGRVIHPLRLASLGVVADGVGGQSGGEEAARRAVEGLVSSVTRLFREAEVKEANDPEAFSRLLHEAALAVHESLVKKAAEAGREKRFATTLTLFLGLWPHAYLLQVGDSRCYVYQDGELTQITRDQTLAEELVANGVLTRTTAERSRWANVLSSSMGGSQAEPVVTRVVRKRGAVVLLCSDGLTKHVPDEKIAERLGTMSSSRQVAEQLLQDALDDGGTDNITMIVGRTLPTE